MGKRLGANLYQDRGRIDPEFLNRGLGSLASPKLTAYNSAMAIYKKFPYWVWVVGASVAWAIVLLVTWQRISPARFHNVLIFFGGYVFGALAASIARKVYK